MTLSEKETNFFTAVAHRDQIVFILFVINKKTRHLFSNTVPESEL